MSNPPSVAVLLLLRLVLTLRGAGVGRVTHVDFAILEALLQVVIDGLVRDLTDQRQIRDSHLLLLGRLEDGLGRELGRLLPRTSRTAGRRCVLLAPGALGYRTL